MKKNERLFKKKIFFFQSMQENNNFKIAKPTIQGPVGLQQCKNCPVFIGW
jgi:hypothetical protein